MSRCRLIVLVIGVICAAASHAQAVVTVNNQGGGDAFTIQAGIDLAITTLDPVVEIVGGVEYSGNGNRNITLRGNGLTVRSVAPGPQAVVDAGNQLGFTFPNFQSPYVVVLETLHVRNATRAISCQSSGVTLTVRDCLLDSCEVGIEIAYSSGPVEVRDCTVTNNSAYGIWAGGPMTIVNCDILENQVGITTDDLWWPQLSGSNISRNIGNGYQGEGADVSNCRFEGNGGWGICNGPWGTVVENSVVVGNAIGGIDVATDRSIGGGLVRDCTVMDNGGDGIYIHGNGGGWVERSIAWGNCGGQMNAGDEYVTVTCCIFPGGSGGNFGGDPLVCSPMDCAMAPVSGGDYRLQPDSPARAANSPCFATVGATSDVCLPSGTEACCVPSMECVILPPEECEAEGGTSLGPDVPCDPEPCVFFPRACCLPSRECVVLTPEECEVGGGTSLGPDVGCDPELCGSIFVKPDGTGDYPTIQDAITAAGPGDTIELTDGVFTGTGNWGITFLGKPVTLKSMNGAASCIIYGGGPCVRFENGEGPDSVLEGITLTGGSASGIGSLDASPTIRDCAIVANRAGGSNGDGRGGGISISGGSPYIVGCSITGNSAYGKDSGDGGRGGGVYIQSGAQPSFEDCIISDNVATHSNHGGNPPAGGWGGNIYSSSSSPVFSNCSIRYGSVSGEESGGGGAAYLVTSVATFSNSLIAANSAGDWGSAMLVVDSPLEIIGCTVAANCIGGDGNAVHLYGTSVLTMEESIVAHNSGSAIACSNQSSATLSCCDVFGNDGDWVGCLAGQDQVSGNFSLDPLFCDLDGGDYTLFATSPCLLGNHPDSADCDQIGAFGEGCDVASIDPVAIGSGSGIVFTSPMPARGYIRFILPEGFGEGQAEIFDLSGRVVGARPIQDNDERLVEWRLGEGTDSAFPAGIYFLRATSSSGQTESAKLVWLGP